MKHKYKINKLLRYCYKQYDKYNKSRLELSDCDIFFAYYDGCCCVLSHVIDYIEKHCG